jgi:bacterioferritin
MRTTPPDVSEVTRKHHSRIRSGVLLSPQSVSHLSIKARHFWRRLGLTRRREIPFCHIEEGAVTANYGADKTTVIRMLNEALATEIVCTLRYERHYSTAKGLASKSVAAEFLEHANEETAHADHIAERIVQLGGEPDFNPQVLAERSHAEYVEGESLRDMIREDLVAERIAIESYREFVQYLGNDNSTTRRLIEEILASEEGHAEDLLSLIEQVDRQAAAPDG